MLLVFLFSGIFVSLLALPYLTFTSLGSPS